MTHLFDRFITLLSAILIATLIACSSGSSQNPAPQPNLDTGRSGPSSTNPGAPIGAPSLFQPVAPPAASEGVPPPIVKPSIVRPRTALEGGPQDRGSAGDPRLGRDFALGNCRPCHVVASDQASPFRFANAPDFRAIANAAETTRLGLTVWLTNPHPTMPTLVLAPDEAANVIAYILSLRDGR